MTEHLFSDILWHCSTGPPQDYLILQGIILTFDFTAYYLVIAQTR